MSGLAGDLATEIPCWHSPHSLHLFAFLFLLDTDWVAMGIQYGCYDCACRCALAVMHFFV